MTQRYETSKVEGRVQHINPDALNKNPAFTNVVVVTGSVKTVYVGGQDAVDASGTIIGKGDLKAQAEQVLKNIQAALAAGGAQLEHVIKWNLYVVQGQSLWAGFEVFQRVWGNRPNPPRHLGDVRVRIGTSRLPDGNGRDCGRSAIAAPHSPR